MDQWYINAEKLANQQSKQLKMVVQNLYRNVGAKPILNGCVKSSPGAFQTIVVRDIGFPYSMGRMTTFVEETEEAAIAAATPIMAKVLNYDVMKMFWIHGFIWIMAVFDTWLAKQCQESAITQVTLVTGFDIIFFWVARMMMMSMHFMDSEVPFKEVYIHALVRDEKARKCLNRR